MYVSSHMTYACRRCLSRLHTVHVSPFVYLQRPTLVWSRPPIASQFRTSTSPRNMDLNSPRKSFLQLSWYSIESEDRWCIVLIPQSYLSPWKNCYAKMIFWEKRWIINVFPHFPISRAILSDGEKCCLFYIVRYLMKLYWFVRTLCESLCPFVA